MPQDSTVGPSSFKTFLSDLFLIINDVNFVCNADDNTTYDSVESKTTSFCHCKNQQNEYFSGFRITKWKERLINDIWLWARMNSYKS